MDNSSNLFVVILEYIVPIENIDSYRAEHLLFLDKYYQTGLLIMSGRQVPLKGGVIIAKAPSKEELQHILNEDPFAIHNLANYHIYEFTPTKYKEGLCSLLS
jgi:uncharacterized protein YciI